MFSSLPSSSPSALSAISLGPQGQRRGRDIAEQHEEQGSREDQDEEDECDRPVVALFNAAGKMGAAAYAAATASLRILEDTDDLEPDHTACRDLLFQARPITSDGEESIS